MGKESQFIYIFRNGTSARDCRLHREQDWKTGLSFTEVPLPVCLKFDVQKLRDAGYQVRFDDGELIYTLFSNEPFIVAGEQRRFGDHHVTLYLKDQSEWDAWHQADLATKGVPGSRSAQAQKLFDLREVEDE